MTDRIMRIYVDIDDVLCETAASLCEIVAREFGRHVAYEDVFQFDLQDVFRLTDEEMRRFMVLSHDPDNLKAFPVTDGAAEGVAALRAAGHAVEIVTGRPASSHVATERWLAENGFKGLSVTYVDKYGRAGCYVQNPGDPPSITLAELLEWRYDAAVDDSPKVLGPLAKAWPNTRLLVFSRPWHKSLRLASNMVRVEGWKAVVSDLLV